MRDKVPLTVVILTYNEELNIETALKNVSEWAEKVIVLDSYSTDKTIEIVNHFGADIVYRKFDNYSSQRNYAIRHLSLDTEWMLFLDADEYLTTDLKFEISGVLKESNIIDCNGFYIRRRFLFMDKWIRYGGYYPIFILRLFKPKYAHCEREINEHLQVDGKVGYLKNDFVDNNKKGFSEWWLKHMKYADMEAQQLFANSEKVKANLWGSQSDRKQWIRQNIWNKLLPPLIRPFFYFFYCYILKFGFLDGRVGFIYYFMHALVYMFIIDLKYIEMKKRKISSFD